MKTIILAALIASLPVLPAAAQSQNKPKKPEPTVKTERKAQSRDCSEYGAGFVRVEGTGTCVKVGGYLRLEGGMR
jgi:hypothetical protein